MYDENQNVILNSNVNNTITYTGRRYDAESDLYFYRNRMYNPELARFLSKDPKGYVDGMNLYSYVKNNPLRYLDAMGTTAFNREFAQAEAQFEELESITENGGATSDNTREEFEKYIGTNDSDFKMLPAVDIPTTNSTITNGFKNIVNDVVEFGNNVVDGNYNKEIANSLRFGATTLNVAGTAMLGVPSPQTKFLGVITIGLSTVSNIFAERLDPKTNELIINSTIDVTTSSLPGGFAKDAIIELSKPIINNFTKKEEKRQPMFNNNHNLFGGYNNQSKSRSTPWKKM